MKDIKRYVRIAKPCYRLVISEDSELRTMFNPYVSHFGIEYNRKFTTSVEGEIKKRKS